VIANKNAAGKVRRMQSSVN